MNWTTIDHTNKDQIKRQKSAISKKLTPDFVDKDTQTAQFSGSKTYTTTMEECGCIDFSRRKLPCKHIYRLAHELGLHDLSSFGKIESSQFTKKDVPLTVDEIVAILPEDEARVLKGNLYYIVIDKKSKTFDTTYPFTFSIELGIIQPVKLTPEKALKYYLVADLKSFLKNRNLLPEDKGLKKSDLGKIAIDNCPEELILNVPKKDNRKIKTTYQVNPQFEPIIGSLYHRFTRLYPYNREGSEFECYSKKTESVTITVDVEDIFNKLLSKNKDDQN